MSSFDIVGFKFPHKYGFLSLDPVKIEASCREKIEIYEDKIKECIVITETEVILHSLKIFIL